jgi:hypothetical protein
LLSIKYSRERSSIDITGIDSPAYIKVVRPGDIEPAKIAISALGSAPFEFGETGILTVSLGTGGTGISFASAFLESVDIDAAVGEFIKVNYTFVASD